MQYEFLEPGLLIDDQLQLQLIATEQPEASFANVPWYRFEIHRAGTGDRVGRINLRIGQEEMLRLYIGNIGYAIDEAHRGHHYAERACRLLLPFAARHMDLVWITTAPDNFASRRTLERLGAEYVETVDVPSDYPLPEGAIRQKCRYRCRAGDGAEGK